MYSHISTNKADIENDELNPNTSIRTTIQAQTSGSKKKCRHWSRILSELRMRTDELITPIDNKYTYSLTCL